MPHARSLLNLTVATSFLALSTSACSHSPAQPELDPKLRSEKETRFENVRQLTRGGTNAEAYFSPNGRQLVFQHKGPIGSEAGPECDQIYTMKTDGTELKRVSNGLGRTTCPYFLPEHDRIVFSSTFATDERCPAPPDMSKGYVWPIYPSYLTYTVKTDATDLIPFEPAQPRAYNAETTTCQDGSVVFTSDRDGDLELYTGKIDRLGTMTEVKRITHAVGYDGGAVFSPDCKRIAWRTSRPKKQDEVEEYQRLLKKNLVRPGRLEIWTANADGSGARQVTHLGVASFAPAFTPDGNRILFASNPRDPKGHSFDLYLIRTDGTQLERVSFSDTFESFPMFSPDGKKLAFSSNRNAIQPHETNVFIADWIEKPATPVSDQDEQAANRFKAIVTRLSDPSMDGRGPEFPGHGRAEEYVTAQFKAIGLKPYPGSSYLQKVEMAIGPKATKRIIAAHNVVGSWGLGCGKTPPIVIGAHLDHLGMGGPESLEASQKGLHPGADDNASGVAGMIEAARKISANTAKNITQGCFVFAAFTGEELGIAGSSQFVAELERRKIKPKAMLNLDMVGRLENNRLIVFGSDSAKEWRTIVDQECGLAQLSCEGGGDGYGPSDHMAFYTVGVPVLHFFTGPHADYHRTTDTADKINAAGGVQVADVVAAIALQTQSPRQRLHYQKPTATPSMGALVGSGERKGNGAYLGTIPDYATLTSPQGPGGGSAPQGGVRLAGVRAGSPAEKAGVLTGDILTGIQAAGGPLQTITTLEDFMNVLIGLKPDDEITLYLRRDKTEVRLPAKVGKRG